MVIDWMLMSGILFAVNLAITLVGFFIIDRLNFELAHTDPDDKRKIESTQK